MLYPDSVLNYMSSYYKIILLDVEKLDKAPNNGACKGRKSFRYTEASTKYIMYILYIISILVHIHAVNTI